MGSHGTRQPTGFTLAELLTAVLLLGIITTFTIPKVLNSQRNAQRIAVFKETIAAVNEAFYYDCIQQKVGDNTFGTWMRNKMNAIKICPSNSGTQGCWNTVTADPTAQDDQPGLILANGAFVTGLDNSSGGTGMDTLEMDWNGTASPNIYTTSGSQQADILILRAIFDNTSTNDRICTIRYDSAYPQSRNLWNEIFN